MPARALSPANERTPLTQQQRRGSSSHYNHDRPSCHRTTSPTSDCEHGGTSPHADTDDGDIPQQHQRDGNSDSSSSKARVERSTSRSAKSGGTIHGNGGGYTPSNYGGKLPGKQDWRHGILGDAIVEGLLGDGLGEEEMDSKKAGRRRRRNGNGGDGANGEEDGDVAEEGDEEGDDDGKDGDKNKNLSTTQNLARNHGVKGRRKMYLAYYFPFLNWIQQYRWGYLQGDLIAALTMASFYIPMSLSYAENLGHLPPINGLYSFVFNPFIYALLGTCPQMVVGPEAAGSLLVGTVVRQSVDKGAIDDDDGDMNARVAGVVTGMAGAVILIAGLTRLGFLDSVLSRPFLRGFISAIGIVILVDQLIPELGLSHLIHHKGSGAAHGSSAQKVAFLVQHISHAHKLTAAVAFGSFAIIMVCR